MSDIYIIDTHFNVKEKKMGQFLKSESATYVATYINASTYWASLANVGSKSGKTEPNSYQGTAKNIKFLNNMALKKNRRQVDGDGAESSV